MFVFFLTRFLFSRFTFHSGEQSPVLIKLYFLLWQSIVWHHFPLFWLLYHCRNFKKLYSFLTFEQTSSPVFFSFLFFLFVFFLPSSEQVEEEDKKNRSGKTVSLCRILPAENCCYVGLMPKRSYVLWNVEGIKLDGNRLKNFFRFFIHKNSFAFSAVN